MRKPTCRAWTLAAVPSLAPSLTPPTTDEVSAPDSRTPMAVASQPRRGLAFAHGEPRPSAPVRPTRAQAVELVRSTFSAAAEISRLGIYGYHQAGIHAPARRRQRRPDGVWLRLRLDRLQSRCTVCTKLVLAVRKEAVKGEMQGEYIAPIAPPPTCYVRVVVRDGGKCRFSLQP